MLVVLLLLTHAHWGVCLQHVVHVGGLFTPEEETEEIAFQYAADMINSDPDILFNHSLATQVEHVSENSFLVSKAVCRMVGTGVIGIVGPSSSKTAYHVQSMCDAMDIPHIETRPDNLQRRQDLLVNLYPHPSTLAMVYADLVRKWGWESFTLLYEDGQGLVRLAELIKLYRFKGHTVTVRQLDPLSSNHRPVLMLIQHSGEKNTVLDCSIEKLPQVLRQAQQVGLMAAQNSFIITNLDMHTINLEPYQWSGTNITGIRAVSPEDPKVMTTVARWLHRALLKQLALDITPDTLRLKTALVYDAVYLLAKALDRLDSPLVTMDALDCTSDASWSHGASLINFMRDGTHKGLTGLIHFDNQGFRSDFELEVIEVTQEGIKKVGTWNITEGLNLTRSPTIRQTGSFNLENTTLRVVVALSDPHVMRKNSSDLLKGNNQFEGYSIDLIQAISEILKFNYTILVQSDKKNGALNTTTNTWNGMVQTLLEDRADLATSDLTITAEREKAVDFTTPYMSLGISIIYKAPRKEDPKLFSFLETFSEEVWYYMLGAYTGVSIVMFITGRISPKEWTNPYPCIQDPVEHENQFNLKNAFWFAIGSVMQQGTELAPIAISTRMVAANWWFFTLIMVSSYTANLAAVLTVESKSYAFKTVTELANNKQGIKYGAKLEGSTAFFFRDSQDETHRRMWSFMESHPEVWTDSNDQGIEWVKKKPYAYFMESTSIEYFAERDCNLTQIGGTLDNKGYGIAMQKNASYRNALTSAVLQLQENGELDKMKTKWWKERGGGTCTSKAQSAPSQLTIKHVGGVFLVLGLGIVVAVLLSVIELIYGVFTIAREEKIPFSRVLKEELSFVVKCRGSSKPARKYDHASDEDSDLRADHNEDFVQDEPFDNHFHLDDIKRRF